MSRVSINTSLEIIKSVSNPDILPVRILALIYNTSSFELCECGNEYLITSESRNISMSVDSVHKEEFEFKNVQIYVGDYIVRYKIYMSDGSTISKYGDIMNISDSTTTKPVIIYC